MSSINLNDILNSHEVVLTDTCFISGSRKTDLINRKNYLINKHALINLRENLEKFLEISEHPTITTIPEVPDEFQSLVKFISNELNRQYGKSRTYIPKIYQKFKTGKVNPSKKFKKNKKLLEKIGKLSQRVYDTCRQMQIKISEPEYDILVNMIKTISKITFLKGSEKNKNGYYNDTDEKITAFLYWVSLKEKISPALLTRDKDFINLLGFTPGILCALDFLPYNAQFINSIAKNPPILYLFEKEKEKQIITKMKIGESSRILLQSLHEKTEETLRYNIGRLWKQYPK